MRSPSFGRNLLDQRSDNFVMFAESAMQMFTNLTVRWSSVRTRSTGEWSPPFLAAY